MSKFRLCDECPYANHHKGETYCSVFNFHCIDKKRRRGCYRSDETLEKAMKEWEDYH